MNRPDGPALDLEPHTSAFCLLTMRYEREMIAPIKKRLAKRWECGLVLEEFGVGYGVADVIAVQANRKRIERRHRFGQTTALTGRGEVQVLRALAHSGAATFENLLPLTAIPAKRLRQTLKFLASENYIEVTELGYYRPRAKYLPIAQQIWAVEAKMKNWFEGLCQARRYQHFAHRVYLAIFAPNRTRVRDDVLHEHNIGLIAVSSHSAKIIFHPRPATPHNEELFLLSNERIWSQLHPA